VNSANPFVRFVVFVFHLPTSDSRLTPRQSF
jgi:hypothetical protein